MLNQPTLEKMRAMKMTAMVEALERQACSSEYAELPFEARLGLLVDEEYEARGPVCPRGADGGGPWLRGDGTDLPWG